MTEADRGWILRSGAWEKRSAQSIVQGTKPGINNQRTLWHHLRFRGPEWWYVCCL